MGNITAAQVLEQVDALIPNQYSRAEKLRWLAQAEGFVLREIRRVSGALPALRMRHLCRWRRLTTNYTAIMLRRRSTTATARWPAITAPPHAGTMRL